MPETFCRAGDVEICFETFGNPDDPALLLVMGLAMQMLGWHEDLCEELAAAASSSSATTTATSGARRG
jgi:hypothetical protein